MLLHCDRNAVNAPTTNPQTSSGLQHLQSPPRRIITISPNATEMIAALGAADRLIAVSDYCRPPESQESLPRIGGLIDPNLERIITLKPDLVIIRGSNHEVEKLCETNRIALYRDPTESYADIFRTIRELGDLLNSRQQAASLIERTESRIDRIANAIADRPRPRVLFTTGRTPESLTRVTTCGKGTFVDEVITRSGGANIFGDLDVAYPEVSLESIVSKRPEVIIEVMPGTPDPTGELQDRMTGQWQRLGDLPAVVDRRVYVLTDDEIIIPSPRIADAIARLVRLLHPEVSIE
ncbi:MAG: ABC transporter substrate-binding protein [Planctomycetes bacterium]|nr:ABC transporter substrate-binding protein [Planctomycetota bacterium]